MVQRSKLLPLLSLAAVASAAEEPVRLGSFLVIGDWGWDSTAHGNIKSNACQQEIANLMDKTMRELDDVKFIVNVGDSFYPKGLSGKMDPQWDTKWRYVYPPKVRSVPWYSVYGNHDHLETACACGDPHQDCAQLNADLNDLETFYMPGFSWFLQDPELNIEIVALDLTYSVWVEQTCHYTPCVHKCRANLKVRADEALKLFYDRMANSTYRSMLVFSHYPTDYFWAFPDFLGALQDPSRNVTYFGGHRHNTDQNSTTSIAPNVNWLSGGGGGWGCDGPDQGFVVGEVMSDGSIRTSGRYAQYAVCCRE